MDSQTFCGIDVVDGVGTKEPGFGMLQIDGEDRQTSGEGKDEEERAPSPIQESSRPLWGTIRSVRAVFSPCFNH